MGNRLIAVLVVTILCLTGFAFGQSSAGTIQGTVTECKARSFQTPR